VTRRPGARDRQWRAGLGPAWRSRRRSTRGGRGQSRVPGSRHTHRTNGQLLSSSRHPAPVSRRGPWGWDGPGRTGRVGMLLSGWGFIFSFVLSTVVVGRRERDEASPSQQREDAASLSFRCAALQLPEGFSRFDHDDETPWLPYQWLVFLFFSVD
jgi:hypothetical protein